MGSNKRTGMPNENTLLKLEVLYGGGNPLTMPRRMALPSPSKDNLNYNNQQAALEEMQKTLDLVNNLIIFKAEYGGINSNKYLA